MSLIANGSGEQPTGFYNGVVSTSGRFDNSSSSYLNRTVSAGNRQRWTLSFWFKRADIGRDQDFLNATGSGAYGLFAMMMESGDQIQVYGGNQVLLKTTQRFRDLSAWYHILFRFDTGEGTAANRLRLYVNGSEVTSFATDNRANIGENTDYGVSANVDHHIGANQSPGNYLDGYLAEYNFIDGTAHAPSSFGETKNGVWIPIKYAGSYGDYGYRLKFDGFLGTDTSGNSNNWSVNSFSAEDTSIPDCPENNFPVMNPLAKSTSLPHFTEGNLKLAPNAGNYNMVFSSMGVSSGKFYYEFGITGNTNTGDMAGIIDLAGIDYSNNNTTHIGVKGYAYYPTSGNKLGNGASVSYGASYGNGDVIGVALDMDAGKVWFAKNGTYQASGNPAGGSGEAFSSLSGTFFAGFTLYAGGFTAVIFNFGQDGSFAGTETAQGNTDENGIGNFYYAPPSGFLAICTANLPEPTIGPNSGANNQSDDHFNTVIYTGNGQTAAQGSNAISGVGFQPDWVWLKKRDSAGANVDHALYDSTRGINSMVSSNSAGAENTFSNQFKSFDSDGFTVALADDGSFGLNRNSSPFVAWNWKANGGTTVSVSESGNNPANVRQTNATAGFSIIKHTGTGGVGTIAHGLGAKPTFMITKGLSDGYRWFVYDSFHGATKAVILDLNSAGASYSTVYNNTEPTSSVFTVGTATATNGDGINYINYLFTDVEGYSKAGKYNPNNTTDSAFVYTGFKPAMVILKGWDLDNQEWGILDNKRPGYNPVYFLQPQSSAAESTSNILDFLSNGFKIRETGGIGYLTGDYIYIAFAEAPFKYANAG